MGCQTRHSTPLRSGRSQVCRQRRVQVPGRFKLRPALPSSGSLLRIENSNGQAYPDAGFRRGGWSYLRFWMCQVIQTEVQKLVNAVPQRILQIAARVFLKTGPRSRIFDSSCPASLAAPSMPSASQSRDEYNATPGRHRRIPSLLHLREGNA